MGLFDILSGKIGHFNEVSVPAYNSISRKIQEKLDPEEQKLFGVIALAGVASQSIDLFFKPGVGPMLADVKKYDLTDFQRLHAIFIIWAFYDFTSDLDSTERDLLKEKMFSVLDLKKEEFNFYCTTLEHNSNDQVNLETIWSTLVKILKTMPDNQENLVVFKRDFSRICRMSYQLL